MLNYFITIFGLVFLLFSSNSNLSFGDTLSSDDVFKYYANPETKSTILLYMDGIGQGIGWANVELNDGQKLYCPPKDKRFTAEDMFKLYRQQYFKQKEIFDSLPYQPPAFIILQGLIKEYPCR